MDKQVATCATLFSSYCSIKIEFCCDLFKKFLCYSTIPITVPLASQIKSKVIWELSLVAEEIMKNGNMQKAC